MLVIPIDESAPKGRLILPQQQTIRELLEIGATVVACRDTELVDTLAKLSKKPRLVITDSKVFGRVSKDTPSDILLTSFSILFARYKGNLTELVKGAKQLDYIKDGDIIYTWYDYGNKNWANIKTTANGYEGWWTWVPRYAYMLSEDGDSNVEIIFVDTEGEPLNKEKYGAMKGFPGGSDGKNPPVMQETWIQSLS